MRCTNIVPDEKLVGKDNMLTDFTTGQECGSSGLTRQTRREQQKRLLLLEGNVAWSGNLASMRAMRGTK